jgi:protein involved in polysaccharide export with SLBB domain
MRHEDVVTNTVRLLSSSIVLLVLATPPLVMDARAQSQAPNGVTKRGGIVESADYRLMPGVKLRIEVYRDQQLSQSLQVRPDGKIAIGDVPAAGRLRASSRGR